MGGLGGVGLGTTVGTGGTSRGRLAAWAWSTPLAGLQHLTDLDVRGSNITDVSPLAAITTLRYVYAKDNAITTGVASLVTLVNAVSIELVGNNLIPCADLDALEAALGAGVVQRPTTCS